MSRKVLARVVVQRSASALAALFGAWLQSWAARPDPRLSWQDVAIGLGLGAAYLLQRLDQRKA